MKTISGNTLTITPKAPLAKGLTYNLILHTGSVKDLSGNSLSLYKSSFTVSRLLVTSIDPVDKAVVTNDKIIGVQFSEPFKYGNQWIELKNSYGQIKPIMKTISGNTLTITPKAPLAKGLTYNLILHTGSVKDLSGNSLSLYKSSFTVSRLSLAQMKDGISRAQNFYYSNNRLPTYVSYCPSKINIDTFQRMIALQGLEINLRSEGLSSLIGKPVYITSDNIINSTTDNDRINNIVNGLRALEINAYNMGLGPNTHISVLKSGSVPNNALVIDIYGGACAGTLYEMGTSWYKSIRGTREVFTVFWPPAKVITGLAFLERAHDDNFSPVSFTGLAHPDEYLVNNGYEYIYSGDITSIVNAIFYQATH